MRESAEVLGARLLLGGLGILPEGASLALGKGLAMVFHGLDARHKKIAMENLEKAFPDMDEARRSAVVRGVYKSLGLTLAEWAQAQHWSPGDFSNRVEWEGRERAEAAQAAGRGAVMLVGHLGNWEITGAAFTAGFPGRVIVAAQQQNNRSFDRYINGLRESRGMRVVLSRQGAFDELLTGLRSNHFLGILADQHGGSGGEILPFFGRPCSVLRSPVLLARRARCPLLPVVLRRLGGGRFRLRILPAVDLSGSVAEGTARWLAVFEGLVRERPEDWFWVHRRWKAVEKPR